MKARTLLLAKPQWAFDVSPILQTQDTSTIQLFHTTTCLMQIFSLSYSNLLLAVLFARLQNLQCSYVFQGVSVECSQIVVHR